MEQFSKNCFHEQPRVKIKSTMLLEKKVVFDEKNENIGKKKIKK